MLDVKQIILKQHVNYTVSWWYYFYGLFTTLALTIF